MNGKIKKILSLVLSGIILMSALSVGGEIIGLAPLRASAACMGGCVSDGTYDYSISGCKRPTCTDKGFAISFCAVCGGEMRVEVPPTGHAEPDYSTVTVITAPTCLDAGTGTYFCSECLAPCSCEIPAIDHDITSAVWETVEAASCKELGRKVKYCSNCGKNIQE